MDITLYHNPRRSKSRKTLERIEQSGINPTVIEYLTTPPDPSTISALLALLNMSPRELMRHKEKVYSTLELNNSGLDDAELIQAMVDNPILIERPIVVANSRASNPRAVIGRPPENIDQLLNEVSG